MQKAVDEMIKRIESLKEKDNIAVVYHFDVDGCASASLLWRFFQLNNINAMFFAATRGFEAVTIEKISRFSPDKILLLDYVPGKDLFNFMKNYDTEIFDHHTHEEYLEEFDYFTTADMDAPAAVCYTISRALAQIGFNNVQWLGRIGSFWDKTMEHTEEYYEGIYEKELETLMPFNLLVSATHLKGAERLFNTLNESNELNEALEKIEQLDDYKRAEEIFKKELREIEFTRKAYPKIKLSMYWVKTRFKHIRVYVDYLSYLKPGTKIFILDESIRFKFSLRTSLKINLVNIIRAIHKEIKDFNGGGHPQACGAMLDNENVEELLNNFIEKYKKALEDK